MIVAASQIASGHRALLETQAKAARAQALLAALEAAPGV